MINTDDDNEGDGDKSKKREGKKQFIRYDKRTGKRLGFTDLLFENYIKAHTDEKSGITYLNGHEWVSAEI